MKPTMANCFIIKKYDTEQPDRIITLEKGTMVYPTVYGAFMAIENLECDEHNRTVKYAIYRAWIDPNKLDYPYSFKYARQWITGGCYLTREEEFTTFCGGTLRWEKYYNIHSIEERRMAVYTYTVDDPECQRTPNMNYQYYSEMMFAGGHFSNCWFIRSKVIIEEGFDITKTNPTIKEE